jgi:DNA polymerase-3 subunit delta
MVAIKPAQVDAFVAKPNPAQPVVLVFGPDAGLVRERAEALIRGAVDDINDPFSLARLDGDEVSAEPSRLVEEANTIPLFGGRRAVWVKAGARDNLAPAVEALLAATSPDCRVVIEAGDLRKNAPLRALCEGAKNAAVLACYADEAKDLPRLIEDELRADGLTIAPDARAALVPLLGGDRLASRSELRKLALYVRGRPRVELDDVFAVVADASALTLDALVDAAFAGKTNEVEFHFGKAQTAGTPVGSIFFAVQRQLAALHKARLAIEQGTPVDSALESMYLNFRRKPLVEAALNAWTAARLARAMAQLADATLESRKQADLADAITHRVLLSIAMTARRKDSS